MVKPRFAIAALSSAQAATLEARAINPMRLAAIAMVTTGVLMSYA